MRTALVVAAGAALLASVVVHAQPRDQHSPRSFGSIEELARFLVSTPKNVMLPPAPKGSVRYKFDEKDPTFRLPTGDSRATLVRLPDFVKPYAIKITTTCNCIGFKKSIFVPSGTFFDAEFNQTHELSPTEFQGNPGGYLHAYLQIGESMRADRYLVLYTIGQDAGQLAGTFNSSNGYVAITGLDVKKADHGSIRLETSWANVEPLTTVGSAAWQLDWVKFVEAYGSCLQNVGCDVNAMFKDKPVTWKAVLREVDAAYQQVFLDMVPDYPLLTQRDGKSVRLSCCSLRTSVADFAAWNAVAARSEVTFSATLSGKPVSVFGPGVDSVLYDINLRGGRVIPVKNP